MLIHVCVCMFVSMYVYVYMCVCMCMDICMHVRKESVINLCLCVMWVCVSVDVFEEVRELWVSSSVTTLFPCDMFSH